MGAVDVPFHAGCFLDASDLTGLAGAGSCLELTPHRCGAQRACPEGPGWEQTRAPLSRVSACARSWQAPSQRVQGQCQPRGSAGRPCPLPAVGPSVPQPRDAFLPPHPGDRRGRSPPSSRGPRAPSPSPGVPSGSPSSPGATWESSRQRGSNSRETSLMVAAGQGRGGRGGGRGSGGCAAGSRRPECCVFMGPGIAQPPELEGGVATRRARCPLQPGVTGPESPESRAHTRLRPAAAGHLALPPPASAIYCCYCSLGWAARRQPWEGAQLRPLGQGWLREPLRRWPGGGAWAARRPPCQKQAGVIRSL